MQLKKKERKKDASVEKRVREGKKGEEKKNEKKKNKRRAIDLTHGAKTAHHWRHMLLKT